MERRLLPLVRRASGQDHAHTRGSEGSPGRRKLAPSCAKKFDSGQATRERKLAICSGAASLAPEDRIEMLTMLAADPTKAIREKAARVLLTQPLPNVLTALARPDAAPEMFAYCAAEFPRTARRCRRAGEKSHLPDRSPAARRSVSLGFGRSGAVRRPRPAEHFPRTGGRAGRFHGNQRRATESTPGVATGRAGSRGEHSSRPRKTPSRTRPNARRCCRNSRACAWWNACNWRSKGTRDERMLLIRDPCKVVQRAVLQSPQLTEREVESFAGHGQPRRRSAAVDRDQSQVSQELHNRSDADVQSEDAAGNHACICFRRSRRRT